MPPLWIKFILCLSLFISFSGTSLAKERKVLLVGEGVSALGLFRLYETNVLARGNYDLADIRVIFYDGYSVKEVSIHWYDYLLDSLVPYHSPYASGGYLIFNIFKPGFFGAWKRFIWFSKLKEYKVWRNEELIRRAKMEGWDLYEMREEYKKILDSLGGLRLLGEPLGLSKMSLADRMMRVFFAAALVLVLFFYRDKIPKILRFLILLFSVVSFIGAFIHWD